MYQDNRPRSVRASNFASQLYPSALTQNLVAMHEEELEETEYIVTTPNPT